MAKDKALIDRVANATVDAGTWLLMAVARILLLIPVALGIVAGLLVRLFYIVYFGLREGYYIGVGDRDRIDNV
jgi:hypothetical protein